MWPKEKLANPLERWRTSCLGGGNGETKGRTFDERLSEMKTGGKGWKDGGSRDGVKGEKRERTKLRVKVSECVGAHARGQPDAWPSIGLQLNCRYHKSMIQPAYLVHTLRAFQRLSPGYVSEATSYRFRRG